MRKARALLWVLCICMLLPILPACKNVNEPPIIGCPSPPPQDTIPKGYDLQNKIINILHTSDGVLEVCGDEDSSNMIDYITWLSNQRVEDRLNVKLNFVNSNTSGYADTLSAVKKDMLLASSKTEIAFLPSKVIADAVPYHFFHDLSAANYIDLSKSRWYKDAIMETALDNESYYYLSGDIAHSSIGSAGAIIYNKELYEIYLSSKHNPDELYDTVLSGKWTMEEFSRLVKRAFIEKGGDGSNNIYGFAFSNQKAPSHFAKATDISLYYRLEVNGAPVINTQHEKAVEFTKKIYDLFYANEGVILKGHKQFEDCFNTWHTMFEVQTLDFALSENMRSFKSEVGILPYPKADEEQEEYVSLISSSSTAVAIPVTVEITRANEDLSAVIEALSSARSDYSIDQLYGMLLKSDYPTNEQARQMLDIISGKCEEIGCRLTKDFLTEYSIGGLGGIFDTLMSEHSSNFVIKADELSGKANISLGVLLSDYAKTKSENP